MFPPVHIDFLSKKRDAYGRLFLLKIISSKSLLPIDSQNNRCQPEPDLSRLSVLNVL
jgi:hypothetical protein